MSCPQMRVVRLRCISRAKFLIFTTEAGERKIFKPSKISHLFLCKPFENQYVTVKMKCIWSCATFLRRIFCGFLFVSLAPAGTVITDTTRRRLCTPEHDLIHFNGVFELKDVGGELLAPGSQRIAGLIIDAQDIVTDMEQEASMNTLIQTIFWSKGYRRIDAQMVRNIKASALRPVYRPRPEVFTNFLLPLPNSPFAGCGCDRCG